MAFVLGMLLLVQATPEGRLQLTCRGGGTANKQDTRSAYGSDNSGNSAWATVQGRRAEGFEDQVDLWIDGGEGRVRLPRTMLPPFRGGEDGWFKLNDIEMGDAAIIASAAVNFMNKPKLRVDRRTGVISIDGKAGHYVGQCEKVDPATELRKF
jgi:hypothetical protein